MLSRLPYILALFVCLLVFGWDGYFLLYAFPGSRKVETIYVCIDWALLDCSGCLFGLLDFFTRVSFTALFLFPFYSCIWVGDMGDSFLSSSVAIAQRRSKQKISMDWMEFLMGGGLSLIARH